MANEQNLIPFKPGQSGNPAGVPKGTKHLTTIIRELASKPIEWEKLNLKNADALKAKYKNSNAWEAIIYVAFTQAMTGDAAARRWLSESAFGKNINISAEGEIDVVHIYKPEKLTLDDFNQQGAILRERARRAVEAEVSGMESSTGTADYGSASSGPSQ